jgi:CubicO group peptidase (beta-lactamase class C family)
MRNRTLVLVLLAPFLVTGCGSVEPTIAPLPAAPTQVLAAGTGTPLSPTAAPTLPAVPAAPRQAEPRATPTESSPVPSATPPTTPDYSSRDQLTEDARQHAEAVESAYPDPNIHGGGKIASGLPEELDREIEHIFRQSDTPGLAVGVVIDQELVYAQGFGVVNLDTGGEVTPRTLFHMASITKPFVATSIVQLLEQNKLSLDDRIVEHLPYFQIQDRRYDRLTIRQFLTHSSGMPDVMDYHWDEPEYDEGALERYVRTLTDRMLVAMPGERFIYSNMAFEVLGDLIAKVSGQSFAGYVKERILLPLGMNDSSILIRDVDPALLANGHIQEEDGQIRVSEHYAYNRAHGPSSCLYSNVVDMSRWAIANMNRGELEGTRILDASSYELLWTPAVEAGVSDGQPRYIGLSWFLSEYGGYQTVSHGGRDTGYQTNLVMVPDAGVAVVVLSNYSGPDDTVIEVTRLALGLALGSER